MRYTLKEFQEEASHQISINLNKAGRRWREESELNSFGLSAITGAGKTVIAADVLETLFFGNDENGIEPDESAVVLWLSDDKTLNDQSRFRLTQASDLLAGHMKTISSDFERQKFSAGTIYFLNTQKLRQGANLTQKRGSKSDHYAHTPFMDIFPDHDFTIFDTLRNTINDESKTLYLFIDEAHKGARKSSDEESSIVSRIINGHEGWGNPPIPIVFGISATIDKFKTAMSSLESRSSLTDVVIRPGDVQKSGLLKTKIELNIPDHQDGETISYETVLLRQAAERLHDYTVAWQSYCEEQNLPDPVTPLMVVQIAPGTTNDEIGHYLNIIDDALPGYRDASVVHVLEDHTTQRCGNHMVRYMSPDMIQDQSHVRIVIAKESIIEGWDCPRAEVMVSLRTARSGQYITQLIGRLLRTPLARTIDGDDMLNSIYCSLPFFDRDAVAKVENVIVYGNQEEWYDDDEDSGRELLINPALVSVNEDVPEGVWTKLESLPTVIPPTRKPNPLRRLTSLGNALTIDGIQERAIEKSYAELNRSLDAERERYAEKIAEIEQSLSVVRNSSKLIDLIDKTHETKTFEQISDESIIQEAYKRATRTFGKNVAQAYVAHLSSQSFEDGSLYRDKIKALRDARLTVASMARIDDIKLRIEAEAQRISSQWLEHHRKAIKSLPDARKRVYAELQSMSDEVEMTTLTAPRTGMVKKDRRLKNGEVVPVPVYRKHMLSDDDGWYPVDTSRSSWEESIIVSELAASNVLGWYRNPSTSTSDSLGNAYELYDTQKIMRPDFIFFTKNSDGSVGASIVDPHAPHYEDALPKLKGLSKYAEEHAEHYIRVDAVAKINDEFRVLDLTVPAVRSAIESWTEDVQALYTSQFSSAY